MRTLLLLTLALCLTAVVAAPAASAGCLTQISPGGILAAPQHAGNAVAHAFYCIDQFVTAH